MVWNIFYVSIYWEQSPQLTTDFHIFQRGRSTTNQNISPTFSSSGWIAAIHFDVDPSGLNCFASDSIDSIRSGQLLRGDWKKNAHQVPLSPIALGRRFSMAHCRRRSNWNPSRDKTPKVRLSVRLGHPQTSGDFPTWNPKKNQKRLGYGYGSSMGYRHNCFWTRKKIMLIHKLSPRCGCLEEV